MNKLLNDNKLNLELENKIKIINELNININDLNSKCDILNQEYNIKINELNNISNKYNESIKD